MTTVVTTQGVARLYEDGAAGGFFSGSLYPDIFSAADAEAALRQYEAWFNSAGRIGKQWADELLKARERAKSITASLTQRDEELESARAAIATARTIPHTSPDLGEAVDGLLDELVGTEEELAAIVGQLSIALEAELQTVDAAGQILQSLQAPPTPPYISIRHDGTHVVDVSECYTIGADREKPSPWTN